MYILPLFTQPINNTNIVNIWMFLERNGTNLIQLTGTHDNEIKNAIDFMLENDIPLKGEPFLVENIVFVPVDGSSPKMQLFYSWRETPPGTIPIRDVWRSFIWVPDKDTLNVNSLLKEMAISNTGETVYSACSAYYSITL